MSDLRELRDRLEKAPLPDEQAAEERAWRVVSAAHAERQAAPSRSKLPRLGAAAGVAVAALVLALTPAGAQVVDWIEEVVEPGRKDAAPVLRSIPGGGEILVESGEGAWVVHSDGSKRLLGSYSDAAWSAPEGLYIVAADDRQLVTMERDGDVHWSVPAPRPVADPVWSPSGFRIAYRSGDALWVVVGNGTGRRLLAEKAQPVAPAWHPSPLGAPHVLAYVDGRGRTVVRDADTGKVVLADTGTPRPAVALAWSADGRYLVRAWGKGTRVLGAAGELLNIDDPLRSGARVHDLVASPTRNEFAAVTRMEHKSGGVRSEVVVFGFGKHAGTRIVFSGPGRIDTATWSPDGRRLLLGWRDADQWLFLPVDQSSETRPSAVDRMAEQFDPGSSGESAFPRVAGWCCP